MKLAGLTAEEQGALARYLQAPGRARGSSAVEQRELWRRRYWADPAAWARDNVRWGPGEGLVSYQAEILNLLPDHRQVAVSGPRGMSKTAISALAILWFGTTRDGFTDWKVPTTAGAYRQLEEFLWPEVHKWARRLRWDRIGRRPWRRHDELMTLKLRGETGAAFAAASDDANLIEGAHGSQVMYLLDESKSIPDEVWDAIEGVFSNVGTRGREGYWLAGSTPGAKVGRFYHIHVNHDAAFAHWQARAVTLEECLAENMISAAWVDKMARQWGRDSALFVTQVLGRFANIDEHGVVPASWIEDAMQRSKYGT